MVAGPSQGGSAAGASGGPVGRSGGGGLGAAAGAPGSSTLSIGGIAGVEPSARMQCSNASVSSVPSTFLMLSVFASTIDAKPWM